MEQVRSDFYIAKIPRSAVITDRLPCFFSSSSVAAGLRCTLANNAYNAHELAFQYTDSRAKLIFASEDGVAVVRQTLENLGVSKVEADKRIIVMTESLQWAGGPSVPIKPELVGMLTVAGLLKLGTLKHEERFDGDLANETVYLCYSSGTWVSIPTAIIFANNLKTIYSVGTTGKPKGVEVDYIRKNIISKLTLFAKTTHKNIISVLMIVATALPLEFGVDNMLGFLPFYHIYGQTST